MNADLDVRDTAGKKVDPNKKIKNRSPFHMERGSAGHIKGIIFCSNINPLGSRVTLEGSPSRGVLEAQLYHLPASPQGVLALISERGQSTCVAG